MIDQDAERGASTGRPGPPAPSWRALPTGSPAPAARSACSATTKVSTSGGPGESWTAAQDGGSIGHTRNVSCPSSTFCVYGGTNGVGVFNGTTWGVLGGALIGGGEQQGGLLIDKLLHDGRSGRLRPCLRRCLVDGAGPRRSGVRICDRQCPAVGGGSVHTYDGTSWSAPVHLADNESLNAIACPTASFCLATDGGSYFLYDGSSWSAAYTMSDPAQGVPSGFISLTCASSTYCAITRYDANVWEWTGTPGDYFTSPVLVGLTLPVVSCPCSTFCAVAEKKKVALRSGATWAAPVSVATSTDKFSRVSCLSQSFCLASGSGTKNAYTYDGEVWTRTTTSPITLGRAACGSPVYCVAVNGTTATVGTQF